MTYSPVLRTRMAQERSSFIYFSRLVYNILVCFQQIYRTRCTKAHYGISAGKYTRPAAARRSRILLVVKSLFDTVGKILLLTKMAYESYINDQLMNIAPAPSPVRYTDWILFPSQSF